MSNIEIPREEAHRAILLRMKQRGKMDWEIRDFFQSRLGVDEAEFKELNTPRQLTAEQKEMIDRYSNLLREIEKL